MKLRMQTATYQMAREMYSFGVRDLELTVLPQQEMAVLTLARPQHLSGVWPPRLVIVRRIPMYRRRRFLALSAAAAPLLLPYVSGESKKKTVR